MGLELLILRSRVPSSSNSTSQVPQRLVLTLKIHRVSYNLVL